MTTDDLVMPSVREITAHFTDEMIGGGVKEVTRWTYYDTLTFRSSAEYPNDQRADWLREFFQQSVGQALNGYADTNMEMPGAIPPGRAFIGAGLSLDVDMPNADPWVLRMLVASVWQRFAANSPVELQVARKIYYQCPLSAIPFSPTILPLTPMLGWGPYILMAVRVRPCLTALVSPLRIKLSIHGWEVRQAW